MKLQDLPSEILIRIISLGSTETALSVYQVNQFFRELCYDEHVFDQILKNGNGRGNSRILPIWRPDFVHYGYNIRVRAAWSLADSRAETFIRSSVSCREEEKEELAFHKIVAAEGKIDRTTFNWLPQLQMMDHPIVQFLDWTRFGTALNRYSHKTLDDAYHAAICFTCHSLRTLSQSSNGFLVAYRDMEQYCTSFASEWGNFLKAVGSLAAEIRISPAWVIHSARIQDAIGKAKFAGLSGQFVLNAHTQATLMAGTLARLLRFYLQIEGSTTWPGSETWPNAPSLTKIPLYAPNYLIPPFLKSFKPDCQDGFLKTMTYPEFLTSGEWVGYYWYSGITGRMEDLTVDPPMQGIRFNAKSEGTKTKAKAIGEDRVGQFILDGKLSRETGIVKMTKRYLNGIKWEWNAVMTPFGILGHWGSPDRGGPFWIWKAEWST